MKLNKIELLNFRQFKGRQSIEFSTDSNKNVTVIYGENGRGKTGIFRALMFCLFGEKSLSQDELVGEQKKKGLMLVNEVAMKENQGEDVEAQVTIDFSHQQNNFKITRKIISMIKTDDKGFIQNISSIELQKTDAEGNTRPVEKDPEKVKIQIQEILNYRLRDYFLFDGERIERLTRNTEERRKEVQRGIKVLLDLDAMESAKKGLDKLANQIEKEIKNKSTGELQVVATQIVDKSSKIEELENLQECKEQELTRLKHRINEISNQISENEEAAKQERKRQNFKTTQNEKEFEKNELKKEMAGHLNRSGKLVAYELIEQLHEELELHRTKGQLPPPNRKEFVEKLLHDEKCICGTSLDPQHENERKKILEFLKTPYTPGLDHKSLDLLGFLNRISGAHNGLSNDFNRLLVHNKNLNDEINDLESKINLIDEEIGEGSASVDDLKNERKQCGDDIKEIEREIDIHEFQISNLIKEKEELENNAKALENKQSQVETLVNKRDLCKETYKELSNIYTQFAKKVKSQLAEKSSEIFSRLADEETQKDLKKISIDDNYMLDVLNWAGQRRLGEISAGQRQIVSLSFIMALINVAGNIEVPLFMDTPFGRISGVHRDNLLHSIPAMASQWILLVTDTEFTEVEANALRQTGAWNKIYELVKEDEGVTKIVCREVSEFTPKRKSIF